MAPFLKKDEETWFRAVVVTRLAEQLLPTPEIHCLNPAKFYLEQLLNANCIEKKKKNKKAGNGQF